MTSPMRGAAPRHRRILALLGVSAVAVLVCVSGAGATGAGVALAPGATDAEAPTMPANLTVTARTASSITLSWSASSDNLGVTAYGHYLKGILVHSGATTSFTWTGLACGTGYALGVDAVDATGNRSPQASLTAATTACAADTTRPSPVGNLQV